MNKQIEAGKFVRYIGKREEIRGLTGRVAGKKQPGDFWCVWFHNGTSPWAVRQEHLEIVEVGEQHEK